MAPTHVLPADKVGAEAPVTLPPLPGVFYPGVPVELTDEQAQTVRDHDLPLVEIPKPKPKKASAKKRAPKATAKATVAETVEPPAPQEPVTPEGGDA